MAKIGSAGLVPGPQPNDFEIRKLTVKLGNAFVRLTAAKRRKVIRAFKEFAFGNARSVSYWDRWSEDEMKRCFLQLQPISPKIANGFRRWAVKHLETGRNNKLVLKCLMDELEVRTWSEEP